MLGVREPPTRKQSNAGSLGATDADFAPLINELVHRPLRELNAPQDEGVIDSADLIEDNSKK